MHEWMIYVGSILGNRGRFRGDGSDAVCLFFISYSNAKELPKAPSCKVNEPKEAVMPTPIDRRRAA